MTNNEIMALYSRLRLFFTSFDDAAKWMNSPHKLLQDRKPIDCTFIEVRAIIDQLDSGAFI